MKIQDKINAYLNTAISTTVVMVLFGLFFALFPEFALNLLRLLLAAGFLLAGFSMIMSRVYSRFVRLFSSNFPVQTSSAIAQSVCTVLQSPVPLILIKFSNLLRFSQIDNSSKFPSGTLTLLFCDSLHI